MCGGQNESNRMKKTESNHTPALLAELVDRIISITREGAAETPPGCNDGARLVIIRNVALAWKEEVGL